LFKKGASQASKWIKNFADEKVIGQMGSTVVALLLDPRNPTRAMGLHAGDSRLYRYRQEELKLLTTDHSTVAALAATLGRDPDSLPSKYQNELVRAVGLSETVELEETPIDVTSGDVFLLCSDGLTKMLPDRQIAKLLKPEGEKTAAMIARTLVDEANAAGGRDNISVVVVKLGDLSKLPKIEEPEDDATTVVAPGNLTHTGVPVPAKAPLDVQEDLDTADTRQGDTPQTDEATPKGDTKPLSPADPGPKSVSPPSPDQNPDAKSGGMAAQAKPVWKGAIIIALMAGAIGAGLWFRYLGRRTAFVVNASASTNGFSKPSPAWRNPQ
jgi:hypothetical protein